MCIRDRYASGADLPNISVGDAAVVGANATGTVGRISPAIDPQSGKAEVIVSIDNTPAAPLVGQTVTVSIESKKLAQTTPVYLLPIAAVKTNSLSYVFSVDENNLVFEIPVKTGALVGENIEVTTDVAPNTKIIASVMGLVPGEKVVPGN